MLKGASYIAEGFNLLFKPKIRSFVFIPLLINIVLFSLAIFLLGKYAETIVLNYIGEKANWWLIC